MRISARIFFFLIISLLFATCSGKRDEEFDLYRFVDRLDKEQIVASPYLGLEKHLQKVRQKWSVRDLVPLDLEGQTFQTLSTQRPVLFWSTEKPKGILRMISGGEDIPFEEFADPDVLSWDLRKGEYEFENFAASGTNQVDLFILKAERKLSRQLLLPAGDFLMQIWAESRDPEAQNPHMHVELDGQPIGTIIVGPYKRYTLTGKAQLGWNSISLQVEHGENSSSQTGQAILIDKISIKSLRDLVLLSIPDGTPHPVSDSFTAEYYAEPVEYITRIGGKIPDPQSHAYEIQLASNRKYTVEIIGHSPAINSTVSVFLDGEKIFTENVTSDCQNAYAFEVKDKKGRHKLAISNGSPQTERDHFHLTDILVKESTKDAILLLAKMKHEAVTHDMPIESNPHNLKKKLVTLGYSQNLSRRVLEDTQNVLLAPPSSFFQFELKIPPSSHLEFGYGIYSAFRKEPGKDVNFQVVLEKKGEEEVIFSKNVLPYTRKFYGDVDKERIDFSPYADTEVRIKFITTFAPSSPKKRATEKTIPEEIEFAYWENPVIYRSPVLHTQTTLPPNVILISLDTLRADHLKCYGYGRETSSHIDRLAADGALFRNTYSSTSWTLPSHMSLLTSLDNRNHGVNKANPYLDFSIVTLADLLRKNGYLTHAITGGALVSHRFGFSKGFDSYREFKRSQRHPRSAEILFRHFNQWVSKNKDKWFFLFLHTYQTHDPYTCPSPYNSAFFHGKHMPWKEGDMEKILFGDKRKNHVPFRSLSSLEQENIIALYDGEIHYTDEVLIGPLIEKLKELGLYQNTMIVLTSDHGEEFFDHGAWYHGHTLYNELIQIPLIIKFPHSEYRHQRISDTVRIVDIMPTILEQLDIDYSPYGLDGTSLIPYLRGEPQPEQMAVADLDSPESTLTLPVKITLIRNGYKLMLNNDFGQPPETYLPVPPPIALVELYDIKTDPLERNNIAPQNEDIVRALIDKIYAIYESSAKETAKKRKGLDKELEETMRALGYIR
ncbi:MAG: sulfatase-like hydrolase/transferase [Candidatus Aminicenantes bacterium]|nr:sulfatase-like hydrolase/transferase [Candidatus Aminicenantes bacterium]